MDEIEHPVDHDDDLVLAAAAFHVPELKDIQSALASIEVHTAIDARAAWATSAGAISAGDPGARASNIIRPVTRVEQGGRNLPNVYHALRNQKDWPQTLERIRLALGDQIEDVLTPADPSGGRVGLALRVAGIGEVPAFSMSDGQLSYLALLGVLRLHRPSPPALVVFDEPDLHLHPTLARRLMADLETFARSTPVLVATQSDAMLDALSDPARSSVLCELDEHHATRLVRPDREGLQRWLVDYRGLGDVRAAGYEGVVFPTLEIP
jgi:predicted ATPase